MKLKILIAPLSFIILMSCSKSNELINTSGQTLPRVDVGGTDSITNILYHGTGSVSQGMGSTLVPNLFKSGIRPAAIGRIASSDGKTWIVPADVNYNNPTFPLSSDLYNPYIPGHNYSKTALALSALTGSDIVTVDNAGDLYTAYIFADNYFEMYVNGKPVGKDLVPYTDFNSSIIRFKAVKPFTVAVKCVDWEENLGLGTESQTAGSSALKVGDGGFVMVIKNSSGAIETITDGSWKAQTFYTAPITNLNCLKETGNYRYSDLCSNTDVSAMNYAIHWTIPQNWYETSFNDAVWPNATTYTNESAGVNNKTSYTNFTDIFDDQTKNAQFIWSTNLFLDNLVLLRKKIQ